MGTALFLLYVNNLPDAVDNSRIAMFADDAKVFKPIKSVGDVAVLPPCGRTDLRLSFNETKCKSQMITRKIHPAVSSYIIKDSPLECVTIERDLGVYVSYDLT